MESEKSKWELTFLPPPPPALDWVSVLTPAVGSLHPGVPVLNHGVNHGSAENIPSLTTSSISDVQPVCGDCDSGSKHSRLSSAQNIRADVPLRSHCVFSGRKIFGSD